MWLRREKEPICRVSLAHDSFKFKYKCIFPVRFKVWSRKQNPCQASQKDNV